MKNKKLVETMIVEKKADIVKIKEMLEREEIGERFIRRKSLTLATTKGEQALADVQNKINTYKKMIKANEEYIEFLEEIKDETTTD